MSGFYKIVVESDYVGVRPTSRYQPQIWAEHDPMRGWVVKERDNDGYRLSDDARESKQEAVEEVSRRVRTFAYSVATVTGRR